METVFKGQFCEVTHDDFSMTYIVIWERGRRRKAFRGEFAWADAQRKAWDLGDLTCSL